MKKRKLSNLGILGKLIVLGTMFLLSLSGVVYVSMDAFRSLVVSMNTILSIQNESVRKLEELEKQAYAVQVALYRAINYTSDASMASDSKEAAKSFQTALANFKTAIDSFTEESIENLKVGETGGVEGLQASDLDGYFNAARMVQSYLRTDPVYALNIMPKVEEAFDNLREILWVEASKARTVASEAEAGARKYASRATVGVLGVAVFVMLLSVILILITVRSITTPLRSLESVLARVGRGDLKTNTGLSGKDEMGRMGASVDSLVLEIRRLIETVNDTLKNVCQIEHSRHRSPFSFLAHLIAGLIAYTRLPKKPSLKIANVNCRFEDFCLPA